MSRLARCGLLACGVLALCAEVATAAEFDAAIGRKGTGRCHMDVCSFFQIETATPIATLKDGTLFAISELSWSASYKPRDDDHEYDRPPISTDPKKPDGYIVFCSKTRPRLFYFIEGKWESDPLRPGDEQAVFGASEAAYNSYWAACHHYITQDPVSTPMATKLGYRFSGGFPGGYPDSAKDPIKQPLDLMKEAR